MKKERFRRTGGILPLHREGRNISAIRRRSRLPCWNELLRRPRMRTTWFSMRFAVAGQLWLLRKILVAGGSESTFHQPLVACWRTDFARSAGFPRTSGSGRRDGDLLSATFRGHKLNFAKSLRLSLKIGP